SGRRAKARALSIASGSLGVGRPFQFSQGRGGTRVVGGGPQISLRWAACFPRAKIQATAPAASTGAPIFTASRAAWAAATPADREATLLTSALKRARLTPLKMSHTLIFLTMLRSAISHNALTVLSIFPFSGRTAVRAAVRSA